jgi:hypothetical protein
VRRTSALGSCLHCLHSTGWWRLRLLGQLCRETSLARVRATRRQTRLRTCSGVDGTGREGATTTQKGKGRKDLSLYGGKSIDLLHSDVLRWRRSGGTGCAQEGSSLLGSNSRWALSQSCAGWRRWNPPDVVLLPAGTGEPASLLKHWRVWCWAVQVPARHRRLIVPACPSERSLQAGGASRQPGIPIWLLLLLPWPRRLC